MQEIPSYDFHKISFFQGLILNSEKRVTNPGLQEISESLKTLKCLNEIKIDFAW